MNELDIEVIKENYSQYKSEHYEDEREMRKLLKMKKIFPAIANEEFWRTDYKRLNADLADGLYYYNELKKVLSEHELKAFVDKVKYDVLRERYINLKLEKYECNNYDEELENYKSLFDEQSNDEQKVIPKVDDFSESLFAEKILSESELIKKVEIICRYQKSTITVFFDITAMLKAEIARLFVEQMHIEDVKINNVITAALIYAFKRTNLPTEIERIKLGKVGDKSFLKQLGFDNNFCRICSEYNRYDQGADYERTNEGDILELVDKFVGLITHREDRLAFSIQESLDLLENKLLDGIDNKYKNKFIQFINDLEDIEATRGVGVMTFFANNTNQIKRHDIYGMIEIILKIRELVGGPINEYKLSKLEKVEKIQDKFAIVQTLQKLIVKFKDKITSLSKILNGYKRLSEGNLNIEEGFDR